MSKTVLDDHPSKVTVSFLSIFDLNSNVTTFIYSKESGKEFEVLLDTVDSQPMSTKIHFEHLKEIMNDLSSHSPLYATKNK